MLWGTFYRLILFMWTYCCIRPLGLGFESISHLSVWTFQILFTLCRFPLGPLWDWLASRPGWTLAWWDGLQALLMTPNRLKGGKMEDGWFWSVATKGRGWVRRFSEHRFKSGHLNKRRALAWLVMEGVTPELLDPCSRLGIKEYYLRHGRWCQAWKKLRREGRMWGYKQPGKGYRVSLCSAAGTR